MISLTDPIVGFTFFIQLTCFSMLILSRDVRRKKLMSVLF